MGYHSSPTDDNFWVSPNYRADDWRKLNLDSPDSLDWSKAVDIFCDRIRGRFLEPVEAIENHVDDNVRWFSGFLILAIDCLIIETLYQFYNGVNETNIDHKIAFWRFFRVSPHFKHHFTRQKAYKFYTHFRCGILHQAQTKMASKVRIDQPQMVLLVDPNDIDQGLIIDREKFHQALEDEICDYESKLKHPLSSQDYKLRVNFKDKMNFIVN